ncbi:MULTISPECIES: hypothetical protein [Chryseobacterium]|jgi:hypothetical protein|uniref:hypothetical protein n=1 Tax=Chryseobacterium TaxID=59732 RepID=UPI0016290264|nr:MULTISPECIES: hypothetical protein [Chryseobacterium]MDR3026605.1 hypothetical protein [Chryseobacterium sp.]
MDKNDYFKISTYGNRLRDLDNFRNGFIEYLSNKGLFEIDNLDDLIYFSLKFLYPINKNLRNTEKSIENKAGEVLDYFKIKTLKPSSIIKHGASGKMEVITNDEKIKQSYKQRYLEDILRLKTVPKPIYNDLKLKTEEHLKKISFNIQYYSNLEFIKDFRENDRKPSKHEERTQLDFYFRCIDEQQKILSFIHNGDLRDRAIAKSTLYLKFIPSSFILGFHDFPYYSSRTYAEGYFNHNSISKSAHRINDLPDEEMYKMENLYEKDKSKFYNLYFKSNSKLQIFEEIENYLAVLPLSDDRKKIIDELRYLFKNKRWISFYGLALSQIEGIFSEMIKYISSKKAQNKSLFYKVDVLREFYILSAFYFDYFQYYIPNLRNKYSHGILSGEEKKDINSFDLLTDIRFLLKVFTELDSPYINLTNTMSKPNYQITSIDDIVIIFQLINLLKPEHKKELKSKLEVFFQLQLIENNHLLYLLYESKDEINLKILNFSTWFEYIFNYKINIINATYQEIRDFLTVEENLNLLKEESFVWDDGIQKLYFYNQFYCNYKTKLSAVISSNHKQIIEDIFINNKAVLNKISFIHNLITNKPQ